MCARWTNSRSTGNALLNSVFLDSGPWTLNGRAVKLSAAINQKKIQLVAISKELPAFLVSCWLQTVAIPRRVAQRPNPNISSSLRAPHPQRSRTYPPRDVQNRFGK